MSEESERPASAGAAELSLMRVGVIKWGRGNRTGAKRVYTVGSVCEGWGKLSGPACAREKHLKWVVHFALGARCRRLRVFYTE